MNSKIRVWLGYLFVPLIWTVDQRAKQAALEIFGGVETLIPGWLAIRVVQNSSGLFGLQQRGLLVAGMITAILMLGIWAWRTEHHHVTRHLGFAFMFGGALGNLTDRITRGHVIDYLEIGPLPIFNLADGALLIGIILIVWDLLRPTDSE